MEGMAGKMKKIFWFCFRRVYAFRAGRDAVKRGIDPKDQPGTQRVEFS
jgi:hypothetical protein